MVLSWGRDRTTQRWPLVWSDRKSRLSWRKISASARFGVILSGTATDGSFGLEAIKAEGGIAFAQDESARYDSMPRNAVAAGCVEFVLSPENIAKERARIANAPWSWVASKKSV